MFIFGNQLRELENIQMTPYVAGWTENTVKRRWDLIRDNIVAVAEGRKPKNIVKTKNEEEKT